MGYPNNTRYKDVFDTTTVFVAFFLICSVRVVIPSAFPALDIRITDGAEICLVPANFYFSRQPIATEMADEISSLKSAVI